MPQAAELARRIAARDYTVGIVGLGYVGLPLLVRFGEAGFPVRGFDVDPEKVAMLNGGRSYIQHVPGDAIAALRSTGRLEALADLDRLAEPDAILICVPTPLGPHREPDLRYVEATADAIARAARAGQLVCLESTTYPGTTEEVVIPRLARRGLRIGEEVFVVYSPEREDPGNREVAARRIPKVVGGMTAACRELGCALYAAIVERVVPVSSLRAAEATKVLENIYRAVNVALVNELKTVFDRMGIDVWEVLEAAGTKPFGFQAFYPGPGLGGHCIPIDPFYLTWKAREYGVATRFIELAGEVNSAMPAWVVAKLSDALNAQGRALRGAKVLVLGVSYKRDVDDLRESPTLELLTLLVAKGAEAAYSDPYFPRLPVTRRYDLGLESTALSPASLGRFDAVLLATDHSSFPYEMIHGAARLIVDTRGAFRRRSLTGAHVVAA